MRELGAGSTSFWARSGVEVGLEPIWCRRVGAEVSACTPPSCRRRSQPFGSTGTGSRLGSTTGATRRRRPSAIFRCVTSVGPTSLKRLAVRLRTTTSEARAVGTRAHCPPREITRIRCGGLLRHHFGGLADQPPNPPKALSADAADPRSRLENRRPSIAQARRRLKTGCNGQARRRLPAAPGRIGPAGMCGVGWRHAKRRTLGREAGPQERWCTPEPSAPPASIGPCPTGRLRGRLHGVRTCGSRAGNRRPKASDFGARHSASGLGPLLSASLHTSAPAAPPPVSRPRSRVPRAPTSGPGSPRSRLPAGNARALGRPPTERTPGADPCGGRPCPVMPAAVETPNKAERQRD